MKTIEELNAIKAKMQAEICTRGCVDHDNDIRIVVGMGTCGLNAGAREVLNSFVEEVIKGDYRNIKVTQTGCMGNCAEEPMAEVYVPGKEKVTYTKLTADAAKKIFADLVK